MCVCVCARAVRDPVFGLPLGEVLANMDVQALCALHEAAAAGESDSEASGGGGGGGHGAREHAASAAAAEKR